MNLPFEEVAKLAMSAPGVESGLVQQTFALDKEKAVRQPGNPDAWYYNHFYRNRYRVFVQTDDAHHEESGSDLLECIRITFDAVKLPVPKALR